MPEHLVNAGITDRLVYRQALTDYDDVPPVVVAEGTPLPAPLVTIGIPTFRRLDLLVEAVRSVLAQDFGRPFELIVVDNDPASRNWEGLLARVPELRERPFRYYVNSGNVGPFGNWNRCIELAHGIWVSVLNDDDLLDANFLTLMFAELDRDAGIDGIACVKRYFGGALARPGAVAFGTTDLMSRGLVLGLLRSPAGWKTLASRLFGRAIVEANYRFRPSRRISAGKFFWGAILGNGAGFLFRRAKAYEVGGYYPEEYPSADFWFFARFAKLGHLRQHRTSAASVRMTEGSISVQTLTAQMDMGYRLQRILAGTEAPRWYRRLLPTMVAQYRYDFERERERPIPPAEVEAALGFRLPPHRPRAYVLARLLLGGF